MSNAQNLSYAVVQVLHNFGAVATVGGSIAAAVSTGAEIRTKLAWLTLAGWGTQVLSGAAFGMVSYLFYQQFPDIAGIAVIAMAVKILCAASGFLLVTAYFFRGSAWSARQKNAAWYSSSLLSVIALSAAAFLRWFS